MFGSVATPDDRSMPQGTHLLATSLPRSLLTYLGDLPRSSHVVRPGALARGPAE